MIVRYAFEVHVELLDSRVDLLPVILAILSGLFRIIWPPHEFHLFPNVPDSVLSSYYSQISGQLSFAFKHEQRRASSSILHLIHIFTALALLDLLDGPKSWDIKK